MKFLKAWTVLALMGAAGPALAQEPAFLRLDPNATRHVFAAGTVITPSSSIPQPGPGGVIAYTNVHLFQPFGMPTITSTRPAAGPPIPGLYFETPESIACIYRFVSAVPGCNPNTVTVVPKGGSRTIAIVDAYDAPNALADLTVFCLQFGLPVPTNFQVVYAASDGSVATKPPPYDPGWEVEISLDVQWAHAMAPNAKIILVEAASSAGADLLGAVKLANNLVAAAGGGEVSMSWGSDEFSAETQYDSYFSTPGIVYFAAGDSPGTEWPSVSANVVAVGGTSVSRDPSSGAFIGEAAWGDGGGGVSEYVPKPSYQSSVKKLGSVNFRGVPDIDGDWLGGAANRQFTYANAIAVADGDFMYNSSATNVVATLRPRLGLTFGNVLFYGTAGLAMGWFSNTDSFAFFNGTLLTTTPSTTVRPGWTGGGGIEWKFLPQWSVKAEYLYLHMDNYNTIIPSCLPCAQGSDIAIHHNYTDNLVRMGVNWDM